MFRAVSLVEFDVAIGFGRDLVVFDVGMDGASAAEDVLTEGVTAGVIFTAGVIKGDWGGRGISAVGSESVLKVEKANELLSIGNWILSDKGTAFGATTIGGSMGSGF